MTQLLRQYPTKWLAKIFISLALLPFGYALAEQNVLEHSDSKNTTSKKITTNQTATQTTIPISIEADSAEQNEKLGITVYSGNVSIIQGDLAIQANQVKIISAQNKQTSKRIIKNITATGSPAIFSHNTPNPAERMIAKANTVNYLLKTGVVTFKENAFLSQQGSSVKGNHIEYTIAERRIKAEANPENKKTRVKTVITPGEDLLFSAPEILR